MSEIDQLIEEIELYFEVCGIEGVTPLSIIIPPTSGNDMLNDPGSNGLVVRTALDTTVARIFVGTPNEIDVTNPDGVSGAPSWRLSSTLNLSSKALTVQDNNFTIQCSTDPTKKIQVQLTSLTPGTLRVLTIPDSNLTLLGTNTAQIISNKAIDSSNLVNLVDSFFTLQDNVDNSRRAQIDVGNISPNTTRILKFPDISDVLVALTAIQTLTNKTLSGSLNTFLNIPEASLSFTDIVTNNATTLAHGLLPKLSGNTAHFLRGDGTFTTPGGAGLGDVSSNTSVSVVNELPLFADVTGKILKRAVGSGLMIMTNGVLSVTTDSAAVASALANETGSGALVFNISPVLQTPSITAPTGIVKADVGLGNVDNTSDATKNAAVAIVTNKTLSGASNAFTNIGESSFVFADVTTGNASLSAHGFLPKLPGGTGTFLRADGAFATPAGSGDTSSDTGVSVASEVTIFKDTTGKLIGRATGTGLALLTSGVLSFLTRPSGNIVGTTEPQVLTFKTLTSPVINAPTGLIKGDVGLGNVDNTSDITKNAAAVVLTNKTLTSPIITTPTGLVKNDVGLGNVDNTSDAAKNSAVATLLNKRVVNRSVTLTPNTTTITPNADTSDDVVFTSNLASGTLSIAAPSGTPTDMQELTFRLTLTNFQNISWSNIYFGAAELPRPSSFNAGSIWLSTRYNLPLNQWHLMSIRVF